MQYLLSEESSFSVRTKSFDREWVQTQEEAFLFSIFGFFLLFVWPDFDFFVIIYIKSEIKKILSFMHNFYCELCEIG
jgi:hypothetical protein